MSKIRSIRPGTVAELAKRLLLARADEGDLVNYPHGRAVFWVGAGASVSAGLPSGKSLAGRLAQRIAVKLGLMAGLADSEDLADHEGALAALQSAGEIARGHTLGTAYGELFSRLDATQQRDFVRRVIVRTNRRQNNWSHLAIGELVRQRIVHTVLTTNFDDLLLDGLVRCDQLPAIIDGVESLNRMDPRPPVPQLVYLHGSQHTYSPRNSTDAVLGTRDLAQAQGGLFGLLQQCSALVVIGYAGNPGEGVMELLVRACRSLPELPIYWIAHGQQDSLSEVAVSLLSEAPNGRLIAGQEADLFFRELLREARIGVPVWFREPVDHLLRLAQRIQVDGGAQSSQLRDEVEDYRARLRELQPYRSKVGQENQERRELRQLMLSDHYDVVWARLKDRDLDDAVLLQMRADSAYELGRRGLADLLPQAVRDVWALLRKLREGSPEWALAQDRLGDALATMGERGDLRAIRDAIAAYERALMVHTRESMPVKWASTRNNQGVALLTLAEWGDPRALEDALGAFRDTLVVYQRDAMPMEWATAQCHLANALQTLGKGGDRERLEDAVSAYSLALLILTRELKPTDWAMVTCSRASAQILLGQMGQESALRDAVNALEQAAEVVSREAWPAHWATIKHTLGAALAALGCRGDEGALRRAVRAFHEALQVRANKSMPAEWAATSRHLGGALLVLGARGDDGALPAALELLAATIEALDGETIPAAERQDIESLAQRVFDAMCRAQPRPSGSTVARDLPAEPTSPQEEVARAVSRVLVVEDNEVQQILIERMLRVSINEVEVRIKATGGEALEELSHFRPDLVVLDLHLPDMSGEVVLAQMKAAWPRLPVLVYTGDAKAISRLSRRRNTESGQTIEILPKDAGQDEFIRLVPTLFKRRHRDVTVDRPSVVHS